MAWTESNEGRLINNTETLALTGTVAVSGTWLSVPKGALITVAIKSAHATDEIVTIDVEGAKEAPGVAITSNGGGVDFTLDTNFIAEEIMKDIVSLDTDEAATDEAPNTVSVTLGDLGYDYIRFKQVSSSTDTANVVYDVWYPLAKQSYLVKTNGVGADPS